MEYLTDIKIGYYSIHQKPIRQLDISESFNFLQPVYGLGIVNDVYDKATENFYHLTFTY